MIARKIHRRLPQHVSLEDLVQAGALGLIEAQKRFDPASQVPFGAYAQFRIRGAMLDSLRAGDWAPRELRSRGRQVKAASDRLCAELQRFPTQEEMAEEMHMSVRAFQSLSAELDQLDVRSTQISSETGEEEETSLYDIIPDVAAKNPFDACADAEMRSELEKAITHLTAREQQVLTLRYGNDLEAHEIAKLLGVVPSRVSQIHASALSRLKRIMLAGTPATKNHPMAN